MSVARAILLMTALVLLPAASSARVLPKSSLPAEEMRLEDADAQSSEAAFLLQVLQGLVNRTKPRIYLRDDRYEGGHDPVLQATMHDWWRERLEANGYHFAQSDQVEELLSAFPKCFTGALLYDADCWTDPLKANQLNVIVTLCSVKNLLPVTPELNARLKLPVVEDVRGRWNGLNAPYAWAVADPLLREKCTSSFLVHRHPWSPYLTDYAVAHRAMVFWIDQGSRPDGLNHALFDQLLTFSAHNTPVMGCWQSWWPKEPGASPLDGIDELALVKYCSDRGRIFICACSRGNLTVHSGFPTHQLKQKPIHYRSLDEARTYVTVILSDGDNIAGTMLLRPRLWNDPARGTIPLGWTVAPSMADVCPDVLEHYYRTATPNDYFITGCSGYGYVMAGYASREGEDAASIRRNYLDITRRYMDLTDAHEPWNWWMDQKMVGDFAERIPRMRDMFIESAPRSDAYQNSFGVYQRESSEEPMLTFHNFADAGKGFSNGEEMRKYFEAIRSRLGEEKPRFVFLGLNGFTTTPSVLAQFVKQLPGDCEVVRPDEFAHLYRASKARNSKGDSGR